MSVIIKNAQLLLPDGRIVFGNLSFENGVITALSENEIASGYSDEVYDAAGNYLSAGFIDLHTHGAGGYDFMDGSEERNILGKSGISHIDTCMRGGR